MLKGSTEDGFVKERKSVNENWKRKQGERMVLGWHRNIQLKEGKGKVVLMLSQASCHEDVSYA